MLVTLDAGGVLKNLRQLRTPRLKPLALRVVDQQGIFEIETECPWVEVIARKQRVTLVNPHPLEVVGVVTVAP